jgi:tetratricopeptide (TPR) repeat protein
MKKLLPLVLLLPLVVIGCQSVGDTFLVQKVADDDKARVITQAGIDEYNLYLVHREAFDQIPRIREYFTTALQFDPTNAQAQQYITLIDNFKASKLKANVTNATKLLAKTKRTDDDTYALRVSLVTAARIDPSNQNVQKMLSDTAPDGAKLVDSFMTKSKASVASIDNKTSDVNKEKAYVDALTNANKALAIDPNNGGVQGQVKLIHDALTILVTKRVTAITKLVAAGSFVDARTQVNALADLNRRAANSFDSDVATASYGLSFAWAKSLYAQKDYANADTRVDAALAVSRTDEALTLKRQISAQKAKVDTTVNFDAALKDIDRLIAAGDLATAATRISATSRVTTDQAKLGQLDDRQQAILAKLPDLYAAGVQAYKDEDFPTAITDLQIVVGVQVDYEQAGDYLDKAKSKQKLLDQL